MDFLQELNRELDEFWSWAETTREAYEQNSSSFSIEDVCLYPEWDKILHLTGGLIAELATNPDSEAKIEAVLLVMALNNEDQDILDRCEEGLRGEAAWQVIQRGAVFHAYETRWQIAEWIRRSDQAEWNGVLETLLKDDDNYVQRRALLAMAEKLPSLADEYALEKIKDEDWMLRLVSLRILSEHDSPDLNEALDFLSEDPEPLIRREVEEIRSLL